MTIDKVGVVGCGLMGSGIAEVAARAGFHVRVREVDQAALDRGRARIERSLARAVEKEKATAGERDAALERIAYTTDLGDWDIDLDDGYPADPGETTTFSFNRADLVPSVQAASRLFFHIEEVPN